MKKLIIIPSLALNIALALALHFDLQSNKRLERQVQEKTASIKQYEDITAEMIRTIQDRNATIEKIFSAAGIK